MVLSAKSSSTASGIGAVASRHSKAELLAAVHRGRRRDRARPSPYPSPRLPSRGSALMPSMPSITSSMRTVTANSTSSGGGAEILNLDADPREHRGPAKLTESAVIGPEEAPRPIQPALRRTGGMCDPSRPTAGGRRREGPAESAPRPPTGLARSLPDPSGSWCGPATGWVRECSSAPARRAGARTRRPQASVAEPLGRLPR